MLANGYPRKFVDAIHNGVFFLIKRKNDNITIGITILITRIVLDKPALLHQRITFDKAIVSNREIIFFIVVFSFCNMSVLLDLPIKFAFLSSTQCPVSNTIRHADELTNGQTGLFSLVIYASTLIVEEIATPYLLASIATPSA